MEQSGLFLRTVVPEDAEALLQIYAPYVRETAITFEYSVPSVEEFRRRICHTLERYPYLAAVLDDEIVGYAYTGAFHSRAAYDWCAETTIYLDRARRNMGIGKRLYQALEGVSLAQNLLNLNACIAYPEEEDEFLTKNSVEFHTHMGYRPVGCFHKCGYKFGRWYHMVWMEKLLAQHPESPKAVVPFSQLAPHVLVELGVRTPPAKS